VSCLSVLCAARQPRGAQGDAGTHLGESDGGGTLPEALTADVETVLPDETSRVGADSAGG
jgi:hypothetical protein